MVVEQVDRVLRLKGVDCILTYDKQKSEKGNIFLLKMIQINK